MLAKSSISRLMPAEAILSRAAAFFSIFGLGQRRCKSCFHPFFPSSNPGNHPSTQICPSCQLDLLPLKGVRCKACGIALPECGHARKLCANCLKDRPEWDHIAFHGIYDNKLRDLLLEFKFRGALHLAEFFTDCLLEASICLPRPDILLAVPMHEKRLHKRGFNQANELCRMLAKKGGWRVSTSLLRRTRLTRAQEELSAAERKTNLENSFSASKEAEKYNHIWLIDDIMTTGSTLRESCRQLKKAGVKSVSVLFVARTCLA